MFDFIRDIGKPQAEKDREMLSAYVDGQLDAADTRRMEAKLQADPALQAEAEQLLILKQQLRAMPHRRVPRSFVLDPTVYAAPESRPLSGAYPVLRTATALTALVFVFMLGLSLVQGSLSGDQAPAAPIALFEAADEATSELAEAPLAAEVQLAEEAQPAEEESAATAAGVVEEGAVEAESLESADAESLLVQPDAEAEMTLPAEALDLSSTTDDAATNGAAESAAFGEEAAKETPSLEAESAQAEAVAAAESRTEMERTVSGEADSTSVLASWLPLVMLVLGIALVALLILTALAGRQSRI